MIPWRKFKIEMFQLITLEMLLSLLTSEHFCYWAVLRIMINDTRCSDFKLKTFFSINELEKEKEKLQSIFFFDFQWK